MEILRHKTAISRNKASTPTKLVFEKGYIEPGTIVFDWGCGKGKDDEWIASKGYNVIGFDPFYAPEQHPDKTDFSKIDVIICNYVLNVIEEPEERKELIQKILKKAKKDTTIIISVRKDKEINKSAQKSKWKKYKDGFITKSKTFQKGYEEEELINLLKSNGVKKDIKTYKISSGIVCIFKR